MYIFIVVLETKNTAKINSGMTTNLILPFKRFSRQSVRIYIIYHFCFLGVYFS